MALSAMMLAEREIKNDQQKEDIIHGFGQTVATLAHPPGSEGKFKNQEMRVGLGHGYGVTKPSESQPAAIRIGRSNN